MEFDPKHCGNYVYLAKWVQNCGKRCRVKEIDGKWLVCVVDMMQIHGHYQSDTSSRDVWRTTIKGNLPLKCGAEDQSCRFFRTCGAAQKKC